jgi:phosphatidylglycerophosphate synthase
MLDGYMRRVIDGPLDRMGLRSARSGWSANTVTMAGLAAGLAAAGAIAAGWPLAGLVLIALNRFADGLDGAIARATRKTDLGGFLDIVFDFVFYGAIPLAFAALDPARNALAAAFLLATFYVNGASFLAYAVMAAKRRLETTARGSKSLYFTSGLAEGTETIAVFVAACLWPAAFPWLAVGFGLLCLVTAAARIRLAVAAFRD